MFWLNDFIEYCKLDANWSLLNFKPDNSYTKFSTLKPKQFISNIYIISLRYETECAQSK